MSDHPSHPEDFNPDEHDIGDAGMSSKGSTPTPEHIFPEHAAATRNVVDQIMFGDPPKIPEPRVELPAHLEQAMDDALAKPPEAATTESTERVILPGKTEYDVTSEASPESMRDVIRQGMISPEVAEIRKREGRTTKEGRDPALNPEQDEQQPLLIEVQGIMQQELTLLNRITEHEEDMPGWKKERDAIEQVYSGVVRAYNNYRTGKMTAQELTKEIQLARMTFEGYDLMLSPETE